MKLSRIQYILECETYCLIDSSTTDIADEDAYNKLKNELINFEYCPVVGCYKGQKSTTSLFVVKLPLMPDEIFYKKMIFIARQFSQQSIVIGKKQQIELIELNTGIIKIAKKWSYEKTDNNYSMIDNKFFIGEFLYEESRVLEFNSLL